MGHECNCTGVGTVRSKRRRFERQKDFHKQRSGGSNNSGRCIVIKVNAMSLSLSAEVGTNRNNSTTATMIAENQRDNTKNSNDNGYENGATPQQQLSQTQDATIPSAAAKTPQHSRQLELSQIPETVTQTVHVCAHHKKPKKLMGILSKLKQQQQQQAKQNQSQGGKHQQQKHPNQRGMVFFKTIKSLEYVHLLLQKAPPHRCPPAMALHGKLSQEARFSALNKFKSGRVSLLRKCYFHEWANWLLSNQHGCALLSLLFPKPLKHTN